MTAVLVAAIGGHLTQLHMLRERVVDGPVRWVTNDSPQSRSLLAGEDVEFVPYVPPRDAITAARLVPRARRVVEGATVVISTGSGVAVPFLVAAASRRIPAYYVESATRIEGPSLTGRIVSAVPGVQLRTQTPVWAGRRWKYVGSVFEGWTAVPEARRDVRRMVVSLGTMKRYQFRALLDRLVAIIPPGISVLWQVGVTETGVLPIEPRASVSASELAAAMAGADVVVAHAGTGIALSAMEAGKCPVLVPRRAHRGEHVDDHQLQTAAQLAPAGLAVVREVDELSWEDVLDAASRRVVRRADPPRILLDSPVYVPSSALALSEDLHRR